MLHIQHGKKLLKDLRQRWRTRFDIHRRNSHRADPFLTVNTAAVLIGYLVSFIVVTCSPGFAESGAMIVLRPEIEITRQHIYLGDIAQIQTDNEKLQQKLESVEIGRTNPLGRPRTITIPHIKWRIDQYHLNPSQYIYIGLKSIVRYREITLSPEKILASAEAFYQRLIDKRADAELRVEAKVPILPIPIPDEDVKLKFVPFNRDIWKGILEMQVIHEGTVIKKPILKFRLSAVRPVVAAAQDIPPRVILKQKHLKFERRKIENTRDLPLTDLDEAVGKITRVAITQGEVITPSYLKKTYLVSRGSLVTMIAQKGSLKVQTQGKALQNGERGKLIRVMNLTSKKELEGEVIGDKLIRIHL